MGENVDLSTVVYIQKKYGRKTQEEIKSKTVTWKIKTEDYVLCRSVLQYDGRQKGGERLDTKTLKQERCVKRERTVYCTVLQQSIDYYHQYIIIVALCFDLIIPTELRESDGEQNRKVFDI